MKFNFLTTRFHTRKCKTEIFKIDPKPNWTERNCADMNWNWKWTKSIANLFILTISIYCGSFTFMACSAVWGFLPILKQDKTSSRWIKSLVLVSNNVWHVFYLCLSWPRLFWITSETARVESWDSQLQISKLSSSLQMSVISIWVNAVWTNSMLSIFISIVSSLYIRNKSFQNKQKSCMLKIDWTARGSRPRKRYTQCT